MKLRENIELFKHFKKYPEEDGILIMKIIKKASKSQFFYNNLNILLTQAKSFDRMVLKEVADLPMNNLIMSKLQEEKKHTRMFPNILDKYGMGKRKENFPQQTVILNKKIAAERVKEEELIEKALQIHTKQNTYAKDIKLDERSESPSGDETSNVLNGSKLPQLKKNNIGKYKTGASEKNLIIIVKI